jgi:hypothetical protein
LIKYPAKVGFQVVDAPQVPDLGDCAHGLQEGVLSQVGITGAPRGEQPG